MVAVASASLGIWTRMMFLQAFTLIVVMLLEKGFPGAGIGVLISTINAVLSFYLYPVIYVLLLVTRRIPYGVNAAMSWLIILVLPFYFFNAVLATKFVGYEKFFKSLELSQWKGFDYAVLASIVFSIVIAVAWSREFVGKLMTEKPESASL